jgi:hypothetical protein
VASGDTTVDRAAEELYGLPPGDFTRARDERAKALRKDGDRDAANEVKALRKPTVAAWALNQLARRRGKDVERLLKAGEKLRAAQEELLAGGDRAGFQEAAAEERELVASLAADATDMASEAGERGGGLQAKIADTLHAAALDEETAEQLRAGRLVREREAIGGFGGFGGLAAPPSARARGGAGMRGDGPISAASVRDAPKGDEVRTRRARSAPRATKSSRGKPADDAARRRETEARRRLAAARTDERHARKELEAAEKAVAHAESRAQAAEAHAAEAVERAKVTAERLKEARRAQTAARKAHTRAKGALERAEKG